ncbi:MULTISPECIES: (d)CMP kinase [Olivibacter]|jgi:cytidylate kinase|uniref:Cytidylate kinase n=3 Tax=Sphingobacteriaceae TaxID=84566 RepID=F4C228_SPHS2|nr:MULTISPECIES: (d)CMP kinase [Olivibacter]MCL4640793.1 (d)CMP kinase [Olivibacter sp. UJ_SKK_5.1]MDM8174994.1 (d)CMP kinase [Olivibacter sp. 47]MDX3913323.1 (d)CMP kinase [Pseudosphingobacterium sp.]QEL01774.1 (d)CMP kinase [Olivibacter sp. LS-1]
MTKKNIIIAIDGYSSCGKSTVAKALANKLHYVYVDSGAMYRAVTLYFLRNNIDVTNEEQVQNALEHIHIDFHKEEGVTHVLLNEEDVSDEIRQMPVSENVSTVSAIKSVRQAMVKQQQKMGARKNVVMDGRDIGTAVFPHAQVKIFMTADPKIRAERRYLELKNKGENITLEEVFENIAHRDYQDTTRKESPLVRAEDAIILDNTDMTEEQQLDFVLDKVGKAKS